MDAVEHDTYAMHSGTGRNAPAGRLNLTWYCDDSQLPDIDDYDIIKEGCTYRYFEIFAWEKVLYPFGFSLPYTTLTLNRIKVEKEKTGLLAPGERGCAEKIKVAMAGHVAEE